ncbi:helix-turn-helix domain-containing protein (plasmid) [Mycobacterium sp. SMC-2]|uniref:helix-turn-helix domain-containing protein n=1 Tax=Mycobacterium sp. SMC-2 TaxID=2857058 RepID=UPI0021B27659|nr:helix-turn-helix domain-containing protein [Mycobacterium sp. SMC-2]UXA09640.1 helix-turn-helix domain-containing protein [Mycobacterium sp. SMC-2]
MDIGSPDVNRPDLANPNPFLTVAEVAAHYRTTDRTVQRWIREGKLPAVRVPGGRSYRINKADVEAFAEAAS